MSNYFSDSQLIDANVISTLISNYRKRANGLRKGGDKIMTLIVVLLVVGVSIYILAGYITETTSIQKTTDIQDALKNLSKELASPYRVVHGYANVQTQADLQNFRDSVYLDSRIEINRIKADSLVSQLEKSKPVTQIITSTFLQPYPPELVHCLC